MEEHHGPERLLPGAMKGRFRGQIPDSPSADRDLLSTHRSIIPDDAMASFSISFCFEVT
jgi:hypothetical protein